MNLNVTSGILAILINSIILQLNLRFHAQIFLSKQNKEPDIFYTQKKINFLIDMLFIAANSKIRFLFLICIFDFDDFASFIYCLLFQQQHYFLIVLLTRKKAFKKKELLTI